MKKKSIIFITLLVLSSLLVAGAGLAIQQFLLIPLDIQRAEHPIALPFVLMADEILQAQVESKLEAIHNPPTEPPATEPTVTETVPPTTEVPTEAPTEAPTEPEPIDDSWFDDALFIGESRIQGMQMFARLGQADYFCAASMTVFGMLDARLSDDDFSNLRLDQLLSQRDYGKIYIHLGINEIPVGTDGIFGGYMRILEKIRELEPDAVIVLVGCLALTERYCVGAGFDLNVIHSLNDHLAALAESQPDVYRYVDTNAWAADDRGFLRTEITFDGCHLYGENYAEWAELLKEEARYYGIP